MQNVPSPQEIFLPHAHNPTTSYLHNVVIPYNAHAVDLSPEGSAGHKLEQGAESWGVLTSPTGVQLVLGFAFPPCEREPPASCLVHS